MRSRLVLSLLALLAFAPAAHATDLSSSDFSTVQLNGADSGTEPRITVDHNDNLWAVTNKGGTAYAYSSTDHGQTFTKAPATWTQELPTIDVDIVSMDLGEQQPRIFASELDTGGLNFP